MTLTIDYLDHTGAQRSYLGTEDLFDWNDVAEVLHVERDAQRRCEDPGAADPDVTEPGVEEPAAVREEVQGALAGYPMLMNSKDLVDLLIPMTPLSPEEWTRIMASALAGGQLDRLISEDLASGGPGGP